MKCKNCNTDVIKPLEIQNTWFEIPKHIPEGTAVKRIIRNFILPEELKYPRNNNFSGILELNYTDLMNVKRINESMGCCDLDRFEIECLCGTVLGWGAFDCCTSKTCKIHLSRILFPESYGFSNKGLHSS